MAVRGSSSTNIGWVLICNFQLSSFATLFAFGRARLVQPVLTERQDAEIRFFFDVDTAAAGFHVIDDWAAAFRFKWEFPFGYNVLVLYVSNVDSCT